MHSRFLKMSVYCNPDYAEMSNIFLDASESCLLRTSVQKLFQIMAFLMNSWLRTLGRKLVNNWLYIKNWLVSTNVQWWKYVKWEVLPRCCHFWRKFCAGISSDFCFFFFIGKFKVLFVTDVNIWIYLQCILILQLI